MSDLKSTQLGKLFQTFITRCPEKESISMIALLAELVTVTSSRFFVETQKILIIYVHKPKYNFITPDETNIQTA